MLLANLILVANEALIPKWVLARMQRSSFPNWFGTIVGEISTRRNLRGDHVRLPHPMPARACAIIVLCLAAAGLLALPLWAQSEEAGVVRGWSYQVNGVPHDWSHHHLVFSNPGTEGEALANGTYDGWLKIVNEPRYIMQQLQRRAPAQAPAAEDVARIYAAAEFDFTLRSSIRILPPSPPELRPDPALHRDWSSAIYAAAVMPNTYPAKYTFNPIGAATCATDYVVYPTGASGSGTAATIVAYSNLYTTTCTAPVPSVYWAYNTGTGDTVTTSPVLSGDGTKVAFIQSTASTMSLVVLKWKASTGTLAAPSTPTTATNITTCTAPCMSVTTVSATLADTYSSPFYDYNNDVIYVGDNGSHLYKIAGVFNGTVSPTVTSVTLNATAYDVASPVYELVSGCVFVGDSEGYLYSVSSGVAGSVCTGGSFALFGHSELLGDGAANEGIFDAALVDSSAQMVYAFVTDSAAIGSCAAGDNCIVQFKTTTITSGSTTAAPNNEEPLGTGAASDNLYAGTFDNVYYVSSTPASPSGNLYVVGNTGATAGPGNLYRIPIASNVMSAAATTTGLGNDHNIWATPVTEFCNNGASACTSNGTATTAGTDYIFFSAYHVAEGSCTSTRGRGCVIAWNVTTPTATALSSEAMVPFPAATTGTDLGCWGTGAFIIDNAGTGTGESQVYVIGFGNPAGAAEAANSPSTTPGTCNTVTGETLYAVQDSQSAI